MVGRRGARDRAVSPARRERRVLDAKAARLAAGDLLSRRAWTMAELTRRLVRRGAPPDVAASVVDDLAGRGYVDDAVFARNFVETRAARGYGTARLTADLRARGVAPALIIAALNDLDSGAQVERARALGRRRLDALVSASGRRAGDRIAGRLRDYLLRRGFPGSVALRVVRELTGRAESD
jgi:regulatory protein